MTVKERKIRNLRFFILKENGREYFRIEEAFRLKNNNKQDQERVVKMLNVNKVK